MLNYRHLYYFWVVANEGGFARAAERLDMAIQTISAQVRLLESSIGHQLLKPSGRTVALTDAGRAVFLRADEIFLLGSRIPEEAAAAATGPSVRLSVGLSDGIAKLAAHRLLQPVLATSGLKLICHDGELEQLMAELALHKLDLVLACQPPPHNSSFRLSSERLVASRVDWYGPVALVSDQKIAEFPQSLKDLPILAPTYHAALRERMDRWLENLGIQAQIVGEFEDSALLSIFSAQGMGVFPVTELGSADLVNIQSLQLLGCSDGLNEEIYGIYSSRSKNHPLVRKILNI